MMEEMMVRLASLLPAQYRGRYAELSGASPRYLIPV
jgi:hypothetical protein